MSEDVESRKVTVVKMFESAETKEQWLIDLGYAFEDLLAEIQTNHFGVELKEVEKLIGQIQREIKENKSG